MKNTMAKAILPMALTIGSLGLGVAATAPAGAASKPTHTKTHAVAPTTVTGKVSRVDAAKTTFWLTVGSKTYIVNYKKATFSAGSASKLVKGAAVSATGRLAGKNKNVIVATSVKA